MQLSITGAVLEVQGVLGHEGKLGEFCLVAGASGKGQLFKGPNTKA